jgi:hypothetical protein
LVRRRRVRQRLSIAVAAGAVLLIEITASAADDPPCLASIHVDPPRATLGQQVVLRVRVTQNDTVATSEWIESSVLAEFRVERLPDSNTEERRPGVDVPYRVHEERRALFANRPGRIRIGPSLVRCTMRAEGPRRVTEFRLPSATLDVVEIPRTGRPDDFVGTIGPVELYAVAVPQEVSLGETVRLALMVRGQSDLWNLPDPLPDIASADVFRRRPELTTETGPRLSVVRHFSYDVVPRLEGELILPPIRIVTFNPTNERFEPEVSESIRITVTERNARTPQEEHQPPEAASNARKVPPYADGRTQSRSGWVWAAAVSLGAVAGGWAWNSSRRKRHRKKSVEASLARELESRARPDAIAAILRAEIQSRIPGAASMSPEEIAELPQLSDGLRELADVLVRTERARFDPNAEIPAPEEILDAAKHQ